MQSRPSPAGYLAGIDIGTSSVKVLALAPDGTLLARAARAYPLLEPRPGWREQDPDVIHAALTEALDELRVCLPEPPLALAFSSAMHSLLAVDEAGRPLSPLLTWADTRSWAQAERLREGDAGRAIYTATGTPIHPMTPLCKLMWWREENDESFHQAHRFLTIKSYLLFRWTGQYVIDYSDASSTGLFDIRGLTWHGEALHTAGITADQLPAPVPTTHMLTPGAAPAWLAGVPVIIGASDGCLANLGGQVMHEGEVAVTIGTSGAIRICRSTPMTDPRGRVFSYLLTEGRYICGGAVNNGGYLLEWFQQTFGFGHSAADLLAAAAALPPGAGGLLCLPYLLGERAPVWDGRARGAFIGLTPQHSTAHLLRALLEGICFNLFEVAALMEDQGAVLREVFAGGGFTRSPFWVQLLADIFGCPVTVDEHEDASAAGAVVLALHALGRLPDLAAAPAFARRAARYVPAADRHEAYRRHFDLYRRLYPALKEVLHALNSGE